MASNGETGLLLSATDGSVFRRFRPLAGNGQAGILLREAGGRLVARRGVPFSAAGQIGTLAHATDGLVTLRPGGGGNLIIWNEGTGAEPRSANSYTDAVYGGVMSRYSPAAVLDMATGEWDIWRHTAWLDDDEDSSDVQYDCMNGFRDLNFSDASVIFVKHAGSVIALGDFEFFGNVECKYAAVYNPANNTFGPLGGERVDRRGTRASVLLRPQRWHNPLRPRPEQNLPVCRRGLEQYHACGDEW